MLSICHAFSSSVRFSLVSPCRAAAIDTSARMPLCAECKITARPLSSLHRQPSHRLAQIWEAKNRRDIGIPCPLSRTVVAFCSVLNTKTLRRVPPLCERLSHDDRLIMALLNDNAGTNRVFSRDLRRGRRGGWEE